VCSIFDPAFRGLVVKIAGFLLLLAGWGLVVAALALLRRECLRPA